MEEMVRSAKTLIWSDPKLMVCTLDPPVPLGDWPASPVAELELLDGAALVAVPDVAPLAVAKVPEVLPEESAVAVAPAASAPDVVPPRVEPPVPKSPIE